jgi:hypothetical protein
MSKIAAAVLIHNCPPFPFFITKANTQTHTWLKILDYRHQQVSVAVHELRAGG